MTDCENNIVEEMEKVAEKIFNDEGSSTANQKLLGMREVLIGVVVKEWVATSNERADFLQYDKALVEK